MTAYRHSATPPKRRPLNLSPLQNLPDSPASYRPSMPPTKRIPDLETLPHSPLPERTQSSMATSVLPETPDTPHPHRRVVSLEPEEIENVLMPTDLDEVDDTRLRPVTKQLPIKTTINASRKARPSPARVLRHNMHKKKKAVQMDDDHQQVNLNFRWGDDEHNNIEQMHRLPSPATIPMASFRRCRSDHAITA